MQPFHRVRASSSSSARLDLRRGWALTLAVALAACGSGANVISGSGGGGGGSAGGGRGGAGPGGGGSGGGFVIPDAGSSGGAELCGNSRLDQNEACDDGNNRPGDGCSGNCAVESGYACPTLGQACTVVPRCGNQVVNDGEACDDGNGAGGDGCSATCQLEPGWACAAGGVCRAARCGDGLRVTPEECDDGNATAGDGCSAVCFLEAAGPTEADGWICPTPGQPCQRTKCGDGTKQGTEPCDDGNNDLGDGCTPFCRREPVCPAGGGACNTACGDGLLLPIDAAAGQECDDGNGLSGDGCSAECKLEQGFACMTMPAVQGGEGGEPLRLPIVYRDFKAFDQPGGHPDFEPFIGAGESGIVQPMLGASGKPLHVAGVKNQTSNTAASDVFASWYKDDPAYNQTIKELLSFTRQASGSHQFSSSSFFPLDGRGFGNYMDKASSTGQYRNFHFTSEVRYWFEYRGNERLEFRGDDDLWVFINKRLALDLGGVHSAISGSMVLDPTNGSAQVCDLVSPCAGAARRTVELGLQVGSVYEIVVFHAERRTDQSNYQLTLSNFSGTRSSCKSVCGDGIVTADEACDLGAAGNEASPYGRGKCSTSCTVGPYCGDGKVDVMRGEDCDGGAMCNEMCKRRVID